ncbi:MAG: phytanoyl-CoA dioxygenase family protein, partial [Candidatus Puniceispirillales bacterium]
LYRPERFNGDALIENDTREAVPDIANNPDQFTILGWDVKPGDAIAFDFRTLHGAAGNSATTRRRAISFRLVGDDARISAEPAKCSPAFPDLDIPLGAALSGHDFPVLYQTSH